MATLERLERFWTRVIDSFQTSNQVWRATFDIFAVADRPGAGPLARRTGSGHAGHREQITAG